jgi:hypothetical protein
LARGCWQGKIEGNTTGDNIDQLALPHNFCAALALFLRPFLVQVPDCFALYLPAHVGCGYLRYVKSFVEALVVTISGAAGLFVDTPRSARRTAITELWQQLRTRKGDTAANSE